MQIKRIPNLKLFGFNNLTKSLSFNMYDICYAQSEADRKAYIEYIDEEYNAERLTNILTEVSNIIGAHILNIAKQDYEPQGASVTMLISEGKISEGNLEIDCTGDCIIKKDSVVGHLDKSHITVHTYPESDPDRGISTFRADIDVSTCGQISPLNALNFLLTNFFADIAIVDYRIRGFTRDVNGKKFFIDHKINSIQNYIDRKIGNRYQMIDVNVYQEKIFHTKMILKDFELDNYLFGVKEADLSSIQRKRIRERLNKEMYEIFYGRNITKV